MNLYLRDVVFWDWRARERHRGNLVVEAEPDGGLRPTDGPPMPTDRVIEGRGGLALEGLTVAHHHLYSSLARGMPPPVPPPRDFAEILERVWWRLDRRLDLEMVRASALAGALDLLRCGVTRVIDHHASPNAIAGSLDTLAGALDTVGLSHVLCLELSDRDGPERAEAALAETDRYLASGRPGLVGLHASFTVGNPLLARAVDLARGHGVGVHLHVAEGAVDQERTEADHGQRVVARLQDAGALELPGTLLVHCLHLDEAERDLVRRSGAWVVHNPESNLNNAVGTFDWRGLDSSRVLLGTDGMHGDALQSLRAAHLVGQTTCGLAPEVAWQTLGNNQRYLAEHHPEATRRNDVVLLDYRPPTPLEARNIAGHVCFGLASRHVRTVIAGGRVVLEDGELVTVDETEVLGFCREQARRLWDALEKA